ncbi:hypothetical protein LGH82_04245 [Mesorhizobium sp. PAMC28654]|uniref:hypothetical protein n=1 Tax=Mesorhizobium sp. PAMC28654 TaxID=2880934 RepID=UPI001D0BAE9C|nr:hypothetical protein [Mesorhizobium sp. PAMC28654]UDL92978.1 hypothetical protein LGH82_04245 [Mesorhizobium sp. PAMC28654]
MAFAGQANVADASAAMKSFFMGGRSSIFCRKNQPRAVLKDMAFYKKTSGQPAQANRKALSISTDCRTV